LRPYLDELRVNWRPLAGAFIGLAGGLMMASYVMGIMAPYLIGEFGWPKSQFALVSGLGLVSVLVFPVVGRLTDLVGVRRAAMVGAVSAPLLFLASTQVHDLRTYAILFALQCFLLVTTTPPVYCRAVVQHTKSARGLALGIVMSGPALTVAVGGPILNSFVATHGWRAGYEALAVFTVITGLAAMLLLPAGRGKDEPKKVRHKTAREDYRRILRRRAFWIMFIAVLLCTMPQSVMMTQLSLVLAANGAAGAAASAIISVFATGMLLGRFLSGLALDRFSMRIVAAIGQSLSAVGLFIFASGLNARPMLMLAAGLFGLTAGAEGDVIAYLVVRNFGVRIYSSVAGIIAATVAISAVVGFVLLSVMLKAFGHFAPFLTLAGVLVLIGSALFLLLPANPVVADGPEESSAEESSAEENSVPPARVREGTAG
jgi:predicted MFS family arabinose efflux permease